MRRTARGTVRGAAIGLALPLLITAPTGAVSAPSAGETCDGQAATIVAKPTDKMDPPPVLGTPGPDVIVGTERDDVIDGGGGNDIICALAGMDVIRGGPGNDRLFGGLDGDYSGDDDYHGDRIEPGPGDDYVDLGHDPQSQDIADVDEGFWDQVSYRKSATPVTVDLAAGTATGEGTDTIVAIVYAAGIEGSGFDDHLFGTDGDDWIAASGGDDVIEGRAGDDRIDADRLSRKYDDRTVSPGNDVVHGGLGDDEIHGGFGTDELHGDEGNDSISALRGKKTKVYGDDGDDYLGGFSGNKVSSGRTTFLGGPGNDDLTPALEAASDRVVARGGPGRDTVYFKLSDKLAPRGARLVIGAPAGTFRAAGQPVMRFSSVDIHRIEGNYVKAPLTWYGTAGPDVLDTMDLKFAMRAYGRGGNDKILTGEGNDFIDGGPGRDVLDGASGRDRCVRGEQLLSCEARK